MLWGSDDGRHPFQLETSEKAPRRSWHLNRVLKDEQSVKKGTCEQRPRDREVVCLRGDTMTSQERRSKKKED